MSLADALPKPEVYYDPWTSGKCYFMSNNRGNFIPVTEGNLKTELKMIGFLGEVPKAEMVSEVDRMLSEIRKTHDVEYAGPLAGYSTGHFEIQNRRVLVTESPRFIKPECGPWPTFEALITNLLGEDQVLYFKGWMKMAITALRRGKLRPGQVLVLAGPAGCGKSMLQNFVTKLLGGRSAKPYQYMTGGTQFNSELFHAEHLMIEDEAASFDFRVRRQLGANIKAFVVNQDQRCHPKNRPALMLKPFWRMSITLNDEPESLMVLPPLDESLQDKMLLLRAHSATMPMPTETLEQWGAFMTVLDAELPHFVHHLLNQFEVPEELRCNRYGIRHFHHPELCQMMGALAPETKLLELIDTRLFGNDVVQTKKNGTPGWEGRASDLETVLCGPGSSVAHEARKLMTYQSACGQYLARLQLLHPHRISHKTVRGFTIWEIEDPESENL